MGRRFHPTAWIAFVAAAAWTVLGVIARHARLGVGTPSVDIYAYTVPNFLYAKEALARGEGVLWNALQNCGQPFFSLPASGLLYPPNLVYALDVDAALLWSAAIHLVVAGVGAARLCDELGAGAVGALCGGLAFQLGAGCLTLASWNPALLAPYAWIPWILLYTERALAHPARGAAIGLAVTLALQVFAGFPQTVFLTVQLVALRAAWELAARGRGFGRERASWLASAALLAAALSAAWLLPVAETATRSLRAEGFDREAARSAWAAFRNLFAQRRVDAANLFPAVGVVALGFAFASRAPRRAFYAAALALHVALAFVAPLYEMYAALPIVRAFRDPSRLLWIAGVATSVLTAAGVDAVARAQPGSRRGWRVAVAPAIAVAALAWMAPGGLRAAETAAGAIALALGAAAIALGGRWRALATAGVPLLLVANLVALSPNVYHRNLVGVAPLRAERDAFDWLREQMTAQDRALALGGGDFSVMPKSASLFGLPSPIDYEPLVSARYGRLFVRMYGNRPLTDVRQFVFLRPAAVMNRPLLNLTATRWVIAKGEAQRATAAHSLPDAEPVENGGAALYANPRALPRAHYVPRVRVIDDPDALLERLASPRHDPARVALLDAPPRDGFTGGRGGRGSARIVSDRSEVVAVEVEADRPGFLVLTDQYAPGWRARVDDRPVPIERANFAFRLVRVPAGRSVVQFEYRPPAVAAGLAISASAWAALGGYCVWRGRSRMRRRSATQSGP